MSKLIKITLINKLGLLIFILGPLLVRGQVTEKHVLKISRYIERFTCFSDTLIDSMAVDDWRDVEVLSRFSDLTHEAYLHAFYIAGMLDILTKIEDKNERASALIRTSFYIKGAIRFMKIANKILATQLNLTENPTIISIGMNLKKDTEMFATELETVKDELEYDYSYTIKSFNH